MYVHIHWIVSYKNKKNKIKLRENWKCRRKEERQKKKKKTEEDRRRQTEARIQSHCGYQIINDLGAILGCGGYLSSLCRTRIGEFRLEQAMTMEEDPTTTNRKRSPPSWRSQETLLSKPENSFRFFSTPPASLSQSLFFPVIYSLFSSLSY